MKLSIKGENILVEIGVIGRPYANSDNIWDVNWLSCGVRIRIPSYTADFGTFITCDELNAFYVQLADMNETLKGKAALNPIEGELELETEINKLGKLEWKIKTQHPAGYGATLCFEFESDQSYLAEVVRELKDILKEYPVLKVDDK